MDIKIGDKVRFLNDVGGGKVSGFRAGGIVLVESEDGFDVPVYETEVVVIDTNANNFVKKEASKPKVRHDDTPDTKDGVRISGKEYLQQKARSARPEADEDEVDEILEARVARLEMTVRKLQAQIDSLLADKANREKAEKEKAEREKAERERAEKEKACKNAAEAPVKLTLRDVIL